MEHYLFLSSKDSLSYHKSNTSADFTVELNQDLFLEGRWKIGLLDLTCEVKTSGYVTFCCDLCSTSWINDGYLPVLRSFYASKGIFTSNFAFPYYIDCQTSFVKRLRLYILCETGSLTPFEDFPLSCTLHIKRQ